MKELKVTSCFDCPFRNLDQEYGSLCNVPANRVFQRDMTDEFRDAETPTSCPLREGSITVTI